MLNSALVQLEYPAGTGSANAVEFAIDPAKFHDAFAAEVPEEEAVVMVSRPRAIADVIRQALSSLA